MRTQPTVGSSSPRVWAAALLLALWVAAAAMGAEGPGTAAAGADAIGSEAEPTSAVVEIDGAPLFRVRGTTGYPAEVRAQAIADRIEAVARDERVAAEAITVVDVDGRSEVLAGKQRLLVVFDVDAQLEQTERSVLAQAVLIRVREAVLDYRRSRSHEALAESAVKAGIATALLLVALALGWWLSRWIGATVERRYAQRIGSVSIQSLEIVRADRLRTVARQLAAGLRLFMLVAFAYVFVNQVLGLFPWTRGFAHRMAGLVLNPIQHAARALVDSIPALIVLALMFLATRYLLRFIQLFFKAAGRGEVSFGGFDPEWADPTYKLVRVAVVALALVVAFPYIPGSGTAAFQGLSIFLGVLLSVGSSSVIANMIAGYMMIYRRAFKVGDRVKIGDAVGDVIEMRVQATHLMTTKNEEVIIPNSTILNNEVTNFSSRSRKEGLILHTTVGIGYETPWRQVEAMLLLAAERTPGLSRTPPPFVRQLTLGDFAVTYELNVYCGSAQAMPELYTGLHRSILDVFNEYGVQIMTPAYEGDTDAPKLVPKDQWFMAPARTGPSGEG